MQLLTRVRQLWLRLSYLRKYAYKYKKLLLIAAVGLGIVNFLEILLPIFIKTFIDSINDGNFLEQAKWCIFGYLSVSLLLAISRIAWRLALCRCAANVGNDIRVEFFESLLQARLDFFSRRKSGDLLAIANNDAEAVRFVYDSGFVTFFDAIFWLITIPAVMFYLSPLLALYVVIPMLIIPYLVYIHDARIHSQYRKSQSLFGNLTSWAQESIIGTRVIKSFAYEHSFVSKYRSIGDRFVEANLNLSRAESTFAPSLDAVMLVSFVVLLFLGGSWVIEGSVTLGTLVAFTRYVQQLAWPMAAVGFSVTYFQKAMVSSERITEISNEAFQLSEKRISGSIRSNTSDLIVKLSGVGVRYPNNDKSALEDISLELRLGEKVALVGEIGCGKSTLLSLVPRLFDPSEGSISFLGGELRSWDIVELRKLISFVPQDSFLFSATIADNILYGTKDQIVKKSELPYYADLADVLNDIQRMPKEFATLIGERGVNLSGGQRQRIAIARGLAWGGKLLILDDALSAVDMQSESKIVANLLRERGELSWLYAGHRLSSVLIADRIVVLKGGKIIQQGTHRQLASYRDGWYWRFYEEQRLEQEMEERSRILTTPTNEGGV